ncbi:hypothetical protein Pelo_17870 [Pelomyxa schiedti]|nr:hypothetical protein Pelo_17870 [Pelomyxa schiedti]
MIRTLKLVAVGDGAVGKVHFVSVRLRANQGNRAESPSPRYGSSMISFAKCLFVFGGYAQQHQILENENVVGVGLNNAADMTATGLKVPIKLGRQAPSGRFNHTAVCHTGNMIIFGKTPPQFEPTTMTQQLPPHTQHTLTGGILNGRRLNDVWIFDISSKVWLKPATQGITPPPMRGHSAAVIGDEMFVCSCDLPANPSSMALFKLTLGSTTFEWTRVEIGNTPPVREFHTNCGCTFSRSAIQRISSGFPLYVYQTTLKLTLTNA